MGGLMKKTLISPLQPAYDYSDPPIMLGDFVVDVADAEFPVTPPLFWTDGDDNILAYQFYWKEGSFYPVPVKPLPPPATEETGPVVI